MSTLRLSIRFMPLGTALLAPFSVLAQNPPEDFGPVGVLFADVISFVDGYLIPLLLAIAFFMFVYGMFTYFIRGGTSQESREQGKQLAIYGVAGFVLILSCWGLVNIIAQGFGFRAPALQTIPPIPIPGSPDCGSSPAC